MGILIDFILSILWAITVIVICLIITPFIGIGMICLSIYWTFSVVIWLCKILFLLFD